VGVLFQKKLYMLAGNSNGACINTVHSYDPLTNAWRERAPMGTARCALAAAVLGDELYALGGSANGGAILASVEALSLR
jgi:N-acetylneuraminic acid mutarotase